MKSKFLGIVFMAALFLLPATAWAVTSDDSGNNEASSISSKQLVPLEVFDGGVFKEKGELSSPRNQINEVALAEKVSDGYKVTLRIGSFKMLDMIQIVKEEKVGWVIDENNEVTQGGQFWWLPAGNFTCRNGEEEQYQTWIDEGEVDEVYNEYYYAKDQVTINSVADPDMDAGTVTIKVKDLNTPILIKTYSDFYGKKEDAGIMNQVVVLNPEKAIDYPALEGESAMAIKWMGFTWSKNISKNLQERFAQAGADTFWAKAFSDAAVVSVDANGRIQATLNINQLDAGADDEIVKIERAVSRDTSDRDNLEENDAVLLLTEYYADYDELEIKAGQVTVPVRDLIYGQGIRVTTKKQQETNKEEYYYGFLHIWPGETDQKLTYTDTDTGITVSYYKSDFLSGTPQIKVDLLAERIPESVLNSYTSFSSDYRTYTFSVLDHKGNMTDTVNPVEKTIPIPVEWNVDYVRIFYFKGDGSSAELSARFFLNEDKTALVFSSIEQINNNCTLLIYNAGEAESAEGLSDGVYKTKVGMGHKNDAMQVSLSNAAFAGQEAYIEVKDGNPTLYLNAGSASFGVQKGYISHMFWLDGENNENRNEADYLNYGTDDNGKVQASTDNKQYMTFDVKRVSLPLNNPTEDNTYWVSFFVPAMDAVSGGSPGSGKGEQPAQLRLTGIEKVESGVNPLHEYDQSIISAKALYLGLLAENSGWSEEKAAYAKRISQESEEQVEKGTVATEDQESVLRALNIIKTASDSLGLETGIYQIPIVNEDDWESFRIPINTVIKDGNMTLQLEKTDGTSISAVEYRGDYGDYLADSEVSDNGNAVSITLPYTEAPVFVKVGGIEKTLTLDFEHAKLNSADLSTLKLLLEKAKKIAADEIEYTAGTNKKLSDEIQNTETLLKQFDTQQTIIDSQEAALQSAIDGLTEKGNLIQLKKDLVTAVKASQNKVYTEKSRNRLLAVINDIKKQIQDEDEVSKANAENYRNQLEEEMAALTEKDDSDGDDNNEEDGSLKSFLEDYNSWVKESDFTKESWEEFAEVKGEAESLLSQGNITKAEEEEAIGKLLEARSQLIANTGLDSRIATLSEKLEEIEDRSSEYAGLLTYQELEASMEAAKLAVEGRYYLTGQEITQLEKSLDAHDKACETEANGPEEFESLLGRQMDIPELELEELEQLTGKKTTDAVTKEVVPDMELLPEAETKAETKAETIAETTAETEAETTAETEAETTAEEEAETTAETEETITAETTAETESEAESGKTATEQTGFESQKVGTDAANEEDKFVPIASISRNNTSLLGSSYSSDTKENGTYSVDYDLWYWDEEKPSMGNGALDYGTEPGKIILKDGKWTVYANFNNIKVGDFEGRVRSMRKITGNVEKSGGPDTQAADYPSVISDYPSILGFVVKPESEKRYTYLPVKVEVEVPSMPSLPFQIARLRVDWDSLEYINGSTDIDSALDLKELQAAIQKAEKLKSKESSYTSFTWKVLAESIKAGKEIKSSSQTTQELADTQAKAIEASINALVKIADDSAISKLSSSLMEAYLAEESDYSANAWRELKRVRDFAEILQSGNDVTEGMVSQATADLDTALKRTGGGSEAGDSLRFSGLENLIKLSEKEIEGNYTAESWKSLQWALEDAREILQKAKKSQCTQADIDDQKEHLANAYNSLKKVQKTETGEVNFKYLKALISRSKEFLALTSKYTDESIRRLMIEYDAAVLMLEDDSVEQEDVDEQKENLRTAINSLALVSGSSNNSNDGNKDDSGGSGGSKSSRKEGYYKVKVRLWHATMDKASAGASAIMSTAYVQIEDDEVTMRLPTKNMTLTGITAHLHDFYIYNGDDYETTELISTEDNKWIFEFKLPDDDSKYYKCKVDPQVDVMGTDPVKARLKVDWSSLSKSKEDDWNKLSGDVDESKNSSSSTNKTSGSSGVELVSSETGIRIKGNAGGPGVTVEASKKTSGTEYDQASAALNNVVNQFVLYDIKLKSGIGYIQPNESVTLKIPVPTGYDTKKLILYRINDNGEKEEIIGKMNGSYYEANIDHFSLYALAESDHVVAAASKADSVLADKKTAGASKDSLGSSKNTKSTEKSSSKAGNNGSSSEQVIAGRVIPYTGDNTPVKELMSAGTLAVLICLGISFMGRKPKGKQSEG